MSVKDKIKKVKKEAKRVEVQAETLWSKVKSKVKVWFAENTRYIKFGFKAFVAGLATMFVTTGIISFIGSEDIVAVAVGLTLSYLVVAYLTWNEAQK